MKQIDKKKLSQELIKTVNALSKVVNAIDNSNTTTKTTSMGTEPEVKTLDLQDYQHASTIIELGKAGWQVLTDEASPTGGRSVRFMRTATMAKTATASNPLPNPYGRGN